MKNLWIMTLFLIPLNPFSQEMAAYISSKSVEVGTPFQVHYEMRYPKGSSFRFSPPSAIFPCKRIASQSNLKGQDFSEVEILDFQDTLIDEGTTVLWRGEFNLIPWDSGILVLQAIPFVLDDNTAYLTSILMESKLVKAKKDVRIFDIKENFTPINKEFVLSEFLSKFGWLMAIILFIIVGIGIWKKRKKTQVIPPKSSSLKEQTLQSIKSLEGKKLWETDQKSHHTSASFILRWYLSSRYQLNLLERTSSDTLYLLKALKIEKHLFELIKKQFTEADAVKFANSELVLEENLKLLVQLEEIVILSSPIDVDDV